MIIKVAMVQTPVQLWNTEITKHAARLSTVFDQTIVVLETIYKIKVVFKIFTKPGSAKKIAVSNMNFLHYLFKNGNLKL